MPRPSFDTLESRGLMNASMPTAPGALMEPNETINLAQDLGTPGRASSVPGSIGDGPDGAADVAWFHFQLEDASRVDLVLATAPGAAPFDGVLSLFNNDPYDSGDPYDLDGHRLMAQVQAGAAGATAELTEDLSPGDYFVAISGAGDRDFSPEIADSGYDGATGDYELTIGATDLGLSGDGPMVVSSDPAPSSVLDSSPLAIRLELSGPLDPSTILAGQTVQLFYGAGLPPAGESGTPVPLASVNFSAAADELQLFPAAPLEPGYYLVRLAGDSSTDGTVLAGPDGTPIGTDSQHTAGADETVSFQVDGVDGVAGATTSDDMPATARDLGDVVGVGLEQVSGAIGVDPSFNSALSDDPTDPEPQFDPANQVDLYHFRIDGPGRYAMLTEAFAGRVGSQLDPGISLWELDPSDGLLVFVAGNNNTLDPQQGTDGLPLLFTDSALSAGLTAGNYYLAVADGSNTPSPIEGQMPGGAGLFDPNQPDSAQSGWSTGAYVLNLLVQPAPDSPQVVTSTPAAGQVLDQAPTQLTVQFSEAVDIQQLAFQAFEASAQETLPQVFVEAADGTRYYPRFLSYDQATNQATFQMLDGLADGSYSLHLSGPGGLTDLAGNPLAGNDPSGDDVIPFVVDGPDRGVTGNMTDGYAIASQAGPDRPQQIGVLFPDELQAGVTINRGPATGASPASPWTEDDYVVQFLQNQYYSFSLDGDDLPAGIQVTLTDGSGQSVPLLSSSDGLDFFGPLAAGTYTVAVGGWPAGQASSVSYQLTLSLVGVEDNAPPLVQGPAPALQIELADFNSGGPTTQSGGPMAPAGGATSPSGVPTPSGGGWSTPSDPEPTNPGGGILLATSDPTSTAASPGQLPSPDGLTGLGMGPIGAEAGGQAGTSTAAPVQVALSLPSSPGFDRVAVSLVTLTQIISLKPGGEGIEAAAPLDATDADADLPSVPADVQTAAAGAVLRTDARVIPRDTESPPMPGPRPSLEEQSLADLAGTASSGRPVALAEVSMVLTDPTVMTTTTVDRDDFGAIGHAWVQRLTIGAALLFAANRVRARVRGLQWRKKVCAGSNRPEGATGVRGPHLGTNSIRPSGAMAAACSAAGRGLPDHFS